MKKLILSIMLVFSTVGFTKEVWITVDADALNSIQKNFHNSKVVKQDGEVALIQIDEHWLNWLSEYMHHQFNRCGGYMFHEDYNQAVKSFEAKSARSFAKGMIFADLTITEQSTVAPLLEQVQAINIQSSIQKLSSYHNRYYQADTGVESQKWVLNKWAALAKNRDDVEVKFFEHRSWKQPSVIMTVIGSESPDEIVVIGGHGDSIAGYWGGAGKRAPGADDNASGISTITEVIRVLMENNYRPKKTLKFMSYAAEEVGLRGSQEIAKSFERAGKNVLGVIQLDMTNFKGTKDKDIVMMTDYTNARQNEYLGKIIDEYVKVAWGYSKCGYGCSDHASWHNAGFPASMPFESNKGDMNRKIHTANDLISASGGNATHAAKFAKMAVAFAVEMTAK